MSKVISKSEVEQLQVGDMLPNMFGVLEPVVKINYKGVDNQGRIFAHYFQSFGGGGSQLSAILKEGEECPR